jgi:hypothetical protein
LIISRRPAACAPIFALIVGLCAGFGPTACQAADAAPVSTFVVLGEDGARMARAVTPADHCPALLIDGRPSPMSVRAPAQTLAQRPTRSDPALSKPSVFDALVCEAGIPTKARAASIDGRKLPLPPAVIRRIVVIGDTGCRIKSADNAYQACNDAKAYPFAKVAAAAAKWRPDLVIHVGDYLYRENPCPLGQSGCAGSVWGYGLDAWRADFLNPADPLLRAAPWAAVRGNHESCARAGQGWWRMIDPRPLQAGRDCNDAAHDDMGDYSDPYAVPLGEGAQLIVFDSSNTPGKPLSADDIRFARYQDTYAKIEALARRAPHNMLADHHPILAYAAILSKTGERKIEPGNGGLQSAFGAANPGLIPAQVDLLLSGHVHVWEALSFSSAHPAQIVAGFSGTQEDIVPLPATPPSSPPVAPGAVVAAMCSWVDGFGFMTLIRTGPAAWRAEVRDMAGAVVNTCHIEGPRLRCEKGQVSHP